MTILGLIPARGGSKGIADKAIVPCAGHPLLYYTAREAHASRRLTRTILSTDSEKIAAAGNSNVGSQYGQAAKKESFDNESNE